MPKKLSCTVSFFNTNVTVKVLNYFYIFYFKRLIFLLIEVSTKAILKSLELLMKFLFQSSALKFKTLFGSKKPHCTGNTGIIFVFKFCLSQRLSLPKYTRRFHYTDQFVIKNTFSRMPWNRFTKALMQNVKLRNHFLS